MPKKLVPGISVGETIEEEVTPHDFGRVAASTAKQVLTQKFVKLKEIVLLKNLAESKMN
ncbi:MAG: hypothetical protein L6V78_05945 [Clostridium sp.]|nr:MAG: hypothetical protein L6V78_05945 [Clostridium sp.]